MSEVWKDSGDLLNRILHMWTEKQMRSSIGAELAQGELVRPRLTEENNSGLDTAKTIGRMSKNGKVVK